jgi:hypothetical protein
MVGTPNAIAGVIVKVLCARWTFWQAMNSPTAASWFSSLLPNPLVGRVDPISILALIRNHLNFAANVETPRRRSSPPAGYSPASGGVRPRDRAMALLHPIALISQERILARTQSAAP